MGRTAGGAILRYRGTRAARRAAHMPGQGRIGDKSQVPICNHGCLACPHPCVGPGVEGSPNVKVNGRPALRMDDPGIHGGCCMKNDWSAASGSATVFINGKPAHRVGDEGQHCGGLGHLKEGSSNVITGGPELKRAIDKRNQLGEALRKITDAMDELQPNAIRDIKR
jgi:uncharacterized Zn-binding protein involved in type VI secretion